MVIKLPGIKDLPRTKKALQRRMDTLLLTPAGVKAWKPPPFQRPLKVNAKVVALSEELKENGGVIPGVLTLGELGRETYLLDGQHRVEAFLMADLREGYADVRIASFEDMADMGEEFVDLNSRLVNLKPDDVLRGLEGSMPSMREIRKKCPYITYGQVRYGANSPLLSMNAALKVWSAGITEIPARKTRSAIDIARELSDEETKFLVQFFGTIYGAWGADKEYYRLWGALNLTLCSWLWRRIVLTKYSGKSVQVTAAQFGEAAMGLSADSHYLAWLMGRNIGERDRSPCYSRIKTIFVQRLSAMLGRNPMLPAPAWATSK